MSPRIVSKTEYEALKIIAKQLHNNEKVDSVFSNIFCLYIQDIIRKIELLELDKTITNTVNSSEYKAKLYDELMIASINEIQKIDSKKSIYEEKSSEYTSFGTLELWKKFVFAYIQKCYFFGIVPDKTHLEFLQPQQIKKISQFKSKKISKKFIKTNKK